MARAIYDAWNTDWYEDGAEVVFTGLSWNATVAPGASQTFGFCANL